MGVFSYFDKKYKHLRRYNQILRVFFKYGFEDLVSYMEEKDQYRFIRRFILPKSFLTFSSWAICFKMFASPRVAK